jgi:hypothetical protein
MQSPVLITRSLTDSQQGVGSTVASTTITAVKTATNSIENTTTPNSPTGTTFITASTSTDLSRLESEQGFMDRVSQLQDAVDQASNVFDHLYTNH